MTIKSKETSIFGIINVNKPQGFTSHDVVAKLRKILKIKQIGHTGTLDPMATGVLPVCAGKATKLIQYLDSQKAYRAYIKLGIKTDTYDMEGNIIEQKPVNNDLSCINSFLGKFSGEIKQKPPLYSAVHLNGKRLYEYARNNIQVEEIPERTVFINSIELVHVDNTEPEHPVLVVDIYCGAGTYIRSIAHDLGEDIGCGACLSGLTRIKAGKFLIENSFEISEVEKYSEENKISEILINPIDVLDLEKLYLDETLLNKIKNGQYFMTDKIFSGDMIQLIFENKLAGIARTQDNIIHPINVFVN